MLRSAFVLLTLMAAMFSSGCATHDHAVTIFNDWRTGTEFSPYRSIPAAIQCDDCRYQK